jgi:hypothetical protein
MQLVSNQGWLLGQKPIEVLSSHFTLDSLDWTRDQNYTPPWPLPVVPLATTLDMASRRKGRGLHMRLVGAGCSSCSCGPLSFASIDILFCLQKQRRIWSTEDGWIRHTDRHISCTIEEPEPTCTRAPPLLYLATMLARCEDSVRSVVEIYKTKRPLIEWLQGRRVFFFYTVYSVPSISSMLRQGWLIPLWVFFFIMAERKLLPVSLDLSLSPGHPLARLSTTSTVFWIRNCSVNPDKTRLYFKPSGTAGIYGWQ